MSRSLPICLAILAASATLSACGGDDKSASPAKSAQTPAVTGQTECADAPTPREIAANQSAYPNLADAIRFSSLCWESGLVRPAWPDGISKEQALAYLDRVCRAGRNAPPAPQEWYKLHDGPSAEVDDFALAIVGEVESGRGRGFGLC